MALKKSFSRKVRISFGVGVGIGFGDMVRVTDVFFFRLNIL